MPKSLCQVQTAHDILHAVVMRECPVPFTEEDLRAIHSAHDALAWVLGFPCGESTQRNLVSIMKWAFEHDFRLVKNGDASAKARE